VSGQGTDRPSGEDYLALSDQALLDQCQRRAYRSSGPGGQHRNKASTAVRLYHPATGISVHGDESRIQQENLRAALARLRMKIACQVRRPADPQAALPEAVGSCLFLPKGAAPGSPRRLRVGRKDRRFWPVVQFLLDLLEGHEGRLAEAAAAMGVSTSNLASVLRQDRHAFAAAGDIRRRFGLGPLK
jgi:hypothetical protein